MSVSVTEMNMPKCCADCELLYDYMHCSVTGTRVDFEKMDSERLPNCPLVERPKGEWINTTEFDEYYGHVYKCSHCGGEVLGCDAQEFCPKCGAQMLKGDKNE